MLKSFWNCLFSVYQMNLFSLSFGKVSKILGCLPLQSSTKHIKFQNCCVSYGKVSKIFPCPRPLSLSRKGGKPVISIPVLIQILLMIFGKMQIISDVLYFYFPGKISNRSSIPPEVRQSQDQLDLCVGQ